MKTHWTSLILLLGLATGGCDNLKRGTRIKPLERSEFFADRQSSRIPPPHTVAQGDLRADRLLYTGQNPDDSPATELPWKVNAAVLAHGRTVFDAICANCHGTDGYGQGIIVRHGFPAPPSLHDDRLVKAPIGHFFDVITNGYGAMYPFRSIVAVEDRWAVAAYIRALQRSENAKLSDVPDDSLAKLTGENSP